MSDFDTAPEEVAEPEEAPMWKPKDPAVMIEEAAAPAGAVWAAPTPEGEPHPHQQVWVGHESGAGEPQLISEHSLEAMAALGWHEIQGRPRLQENPATGRLEAVDPDQGSESAPDGGEGEEG